MLRALANKVAMTAMRRGEVRARARTSDEKARRRWRSTERTTERSNARVEG
jgi:hypothetical protein